MNLAVFQRDEPTASGAAPAIADDDYVLPALLTARQAERGPRFGDDHWDLRPFVPRTERQARIDFTTLVDRVAIVTLKEYLYSRLRRAVPVGQLSTQSTRPAKLTSLVGEFNALRFILATLAEAGVPRLSQASQEDLDAVVAACLDRPAWASVLVRTIRHLAAHGPFLSLDRLAIHPWPGRSDSGVTGTLRREENATARIPEHIAGPLIKAAVFYVETASADLFAARQEVAALQAVRAARGARFIGRHGAGEAIEAFIAARRATGRAIPALPLDHLHRCADEAPSISDGVVQVPGMEMVALLAGIGDPVRWRHLLVEAGDELGYEEGGLDTAVSPWPDSGAPWRPHLGMWELRKELFHLRTACWIVIAYLSGMRDGEVRELGRDCAFAEPGDDGRIRYKLRGRVYKDRDLEGEGAEWVVLEIVHQAVDVLLQLNDDPTHLFGYTWGKKRVLLTEVPVRIATFRDHCNKVFSTPEGAFIPDDGPQLGRASPPVEAEDDDRGRGESEPARPWAFNTRQFRRTLAWHIAHQPFGVVAGAKQYKHAAVAMFEGYAGTSASGFAAEVASEEATALLGYVEELYRDWNDAGRSSGGASPAVDAEFDRIRRELGDLPGSLASPVRLRTMLEHLTTTLHPGVLNDCFYRREAAVCATRPSPRGRPLPMLDMCCRCPNARRSRLHLPRLALAADQAHQLVELAATRRLPPLQRAALIAHAELLDELVTQITDTGEAPSS